MNINPTCSPEVKTRLAAHELKVLFLRRQLFTSRSDILSGHAFTFYYWMRGLVLFLSAKASHYAPFISLSRSFNTARLSLVSLYLIYTSYSKNYRQKWSEKYHSCCSKKTNFKTP